MANTALLLPKIQKFLHDNFSVKPEVIALQKSPFAQVSALELAQQLKGMQVAEKKFPSLFKEEILYPKKVHLEQSSSEKTAKYKSEILEYNTFIDVTAGLGIDFYYFSKHSKSSTYVEINPELFTIVQQNFKQLIPNSQFINQSGLEYLKNINTTFDFLYIDPSRRINTQKKFLIEDLEPNIKEIESFLLEKASKIMVKLSPMYDVQEAINQLQNVAEIHLVAVKNELKEMLLILEKEKTNTINIHCANISKNTDIQVFTHNYSAENIKYSEPKEYLYLPNAAVLKSKKEDVLAERFSLQKLHPNTSIFTSENYIENYSGRVFKIKNSNPNLKEFKKQKFNLISKNHPLKPAAITQKYKITEGGTEYLIFCQTATKKFVLRCVKVF